MTRYILPCIFSVLFWNAHALDFPVPVNVAPPPAPSTPAPIPPYGFKNTDELDALLAPIALYPDSLLTLILPAVTTTPDIALAVRHITVNGSKEVLAAKPWSESVKALTDFPAVLRWLNANVVWSEALGTAFTYQPVEVMNSVQRLRHRARATGNLVDTAQQRVIIKNGSVVILPALPNNIYVPVYDPAVVYYYNPRQIIRTYISPRATMRGTGWGDGRNRVLRMDDIPSHPHGPHLPRELEKDHHHGHAGER